jgi:glutathione S-transferase
MRLVGMLDSPYVRRTAISLRLMGLEFELTQLSVFRNFDEIKSLNPAVKAPTLIADDGTVLVDSTLILDYADGLAGSSKSLMPAGPAERLKALHVIGFALAACEKAVQTIYERNLRPNDKQHQPWLDRVQGQLLGAFEVLEQEIPRGWFGGEKPNQADITVAAAWRFTRSSVKGVASEKAYPRLAAHSARAEALAVFQEMDFAEALPVPISK